MLNEYKEETENQFNKIQYTCDELDFNLRNTKCQAMEGLIKECEGLLNHDSDKI